MLEKRRIPPSGILQPWVAQLELRLQGVLLTVVRGCDTVPKEDPSKDLSRAIRGAMLHTHVADATQSRSFIETCEPEELSRRIVEVIKSHDQLPRHFIMHLIHAIEILGYKYPEDSQRKVWHQGYSLFCHYLHMNPETERQMDQRLGADEETFAKQQAIMDNPIDGERICNAGTAKVEGIPTR
jgi:hypothetical protein